jgi:hypothetical protein
VRAGGQYAKGAARERARVKWHLENGAVTAHRSAGSHSPIDVTANYADGVVFESLKCGSASLSQEEAESLIEIRLGSHPSTKVRYVRWPDYAVPEVMEVTIQGFPSTRPVRRVAGASSKH